MPWLTAGAPWTTVPRDSTVGAMGPVNGEDTLAGNTQRFRQTSLNYFFVVRTLAMQTCPDHQVGSDAAAARQSAHPRVKSALRNSLVQSSILHQSSCRIETSVV